MGADVFEIGVNFVKLILVFLMMVQVVPLLVWVERRGSAYIQNRLGPNRVGPLGLMQLLADAVKFLTKEEFVPGRGYPFIYYAAPVVAMIPAALAFASLPLSVPVNVEAFEMLGRTWGPYIFKFQGYEIGIGIVFVLGVSSLAAYALLLAGYGSSNKYALYGALRASAQTISYELAMGLSIVGVILLFNTFSFAEIVTAQSAPLNFMFLGNKVEIAWLPNWGIFYQPLGAVILFAAMFAEANRLPFDLPEAEGELVAGYHTEYAGFKFNMFFIGEYGHMLVASGLMVIFFFGGYTFYPFFTPESVAGWFAGMSATKASLLTALVLHAVMLAKIVLFLWIFIWVRWTLPRFRYDQLMDLGWRTMLPWALANTILTAIVILIMRHPWGA
ncbi:MAG TPA: NADH-quinone oxidoreductase subunit H [Bdellovibrionales bacterium]|nr:NADH-quinone oxidoreductase subunit H [Bdellovibrionales bacterium]